MKVLFYPHASKTNKKGLAPLRLRVTVGPGDKVDWATGKFIDPNLWDPDKKRVSGKSVRADIANRYIITSESRLLKIEGHLEINESNITAEIIRNVFLGNHIEKFGLLQIIDIHNVTFAQKIGQNGFSASTLKKYNVLRDKVEHLIKTKYNRSDIYISELKYEFIEDFWHFLVTKGKTVRGVFAEPMDTESAVGIIGRLKKCAKIGFRKQGIHINPFDEFKETFSKEAKQPLTMDEVNAILSKDIKNKRLDRVRDRFIVGCFTGLSNSDIQSANHDMIETDISGQKWINRGRTKTGELCLIPLWDPVLNIIEKYRDELAAQGTNRIFPQLSLQKMNTNLQELSVHCGINKKITTHHSRWSFANLYLNSGGSIEILARILGHSSIRSTSVYAKYNKTSISNESNAVKKAIYQQLNQTKWK